MARLHDKLSADGSGAQERGSSGRMSKQHVIVMGLGYVGCVSAAGLAGTAHAAGLENAGAGGVAGSASATGTMARPSVLPLSR